MEKVTIRLNGSSYINDMELDDRFKVIKDSLWISLLSLVGNPDGAAVAWEGEVSPYLTMDLEKQLALSLEENPAEYLVVDMCYTAGHGLYRWKDQVYTANPKFLESDFLAEHEEEMEFIDVMNDREFDWKPYMDAYLKLVRSYFDADHIILVKSRCANWYVTHTHVRQLRKKGKQAYNRRIREMEDYFIEKMNPYVVNIYPHYFLDYNAKKGFTFSSYERPFYLHAKRIISQIIRNHPEQRVFQGQDYFIRLGRFIKYYDHLFVKNNIGLFMDDTVFLDHLVLQLGREILDEYESDFVEIEARGYKSITEILEQYNFKFAASLRECLKVVRAVEDGDIFQADVKYSAIFEYSLKILDRFTSLVREEVERLGFDPDEIQVNKFNVRHYYEILLAGRNNRMAPLKKYVLAIGGDQEEKQKLGRLLDELKGECKKDIRAYVQVLNRYYKPILVDLWGSCITREILNEDTGRFQIGEYAYRNCMLFAFDEPIPYDESKYDNLTLFENSEWRVGYIKSAFRKDLPSMLEKTDSKWLLVDFYDLVCDVVECRGGVLTADKEVRRLKFYKEIQDECHVTSIDAILDEEEIRRRFDVFIRFIRKRYGSNIVFIKADVKTEFLNFRRRLKPMKGYKKATLVKKKKFLDQWQKYFEEQVDCYVLDYARQYEADDLCVSGAFMVHYEKEFYEKGYEALVEIIYKGCGKKRYRT